MLNENSARLLEEKIKDEKFLTQLLEIESELEVVDILTKEGIDITEEEVISIKNIIIKKLENKDELDDSDLEEVAGGFGVVAGVVIAVTAVISAIFSLGSLTDTVTRRRW